MALARALALSPGLLLLDEPLSALDARVRARLRGEVRDLQQRLGITTIMVTHDQEEALTMSDRIVVMSKGRIDQVGTPDEIYGQPATAFVADFVGTHEFPHRDACSRPDRAEVQGAKLDLRPAGRCRQPGTAVTVCLRPEDVVVTRHRGGASPTRSRCTVGVMEFIGNHFATTLHAVGTSLERRRRSVDERRARPRHRSPAAPSASACRPSGCASSPMPRSRPDVTAQAIDRAAAARSWRQSAGSCRATSSCCAAWSCSALWLSAGHRRCCRSVALLSKAFESRDGSFVGLANFRHISATPALAASIGNSLFIAHRSAR